MPADLDRGTNERLLAALTAAFEALLVPAEPEVVDLHLALQGLALGSHHRPAQLLEHEPGGLIARESELSLQLLGRDPGVVGGDQIGGPEPGAQRGARSVHHRSGRDRGLKSASRALPEVPALEHPGAKPAATGADEALGASATPRGSRGRRLQKR